MQGIQLRREPPLSKLVSFSIPKNLITSYLGTFFIIIILLKYSARVFKDYKTIYAVFYPKLENMWGWAGEKKNSEAQ